MYFEYAEANSIIFLAEPRAKARNFKAKAVA